MITEKKYKLTDEFIAIEDKKLYRIEALIDFSNVKKGDRGGFVECEDNLSQKGDCWIYGDAKVYDKAKVYDDAKIYGNSAVFDNAEVFNNAIIYGKAKIYGNAHIFNDAMVLYNSKVFDNAKVFDGARVYGKANIYGRAKVFDGAKVYNHVKVFGESEVRGGAELYGNAEISNTSDYIVFKNWWSNGRYFTWTRSNNMWSVESFYGTGEELITKAYKDSELSGKEYERVVKHVESILNDN